MAEEESYTKEIVGAVGILLAVSMAFFLFLRKYGMFCLKLQILILLLLVVVEIALKHIRC